MSTSTPRCKEFWGHIFGSRETGVCSDFAARVGVQAVIEKVVPQYDIFCTPEDQQMFLDFHPPNSTEARTSGPLYGFHTREIQIRLDKSCCLYVGGLVGDNRIKRRPQE